MLTTLFTQIILQNAPFRSQIFKSFFDSGGKGALTPLTKIPRTPLLQHTDTQWPVATAVGYHVTGGSNKYQLSLIDPRDKIVL